MFDEASGLAGSLLKGVPLTDAHILENDIFATIKANVGFDRLQRMRDSSPTGGAVGQLSDSEREALQATIAANRVDLPIDVQRANLWAVVQNYLQTIYGEETGLALLNDFKAQHGGGQNLKAGQSARFGNLTVTAK